MKINHKFATVSLVALLGITLTYSCLRKKDSEIGAAKELNKENLDKEGEKDADRLAKANMANLYDIMASELTLTNFYTEDAKKLAEMLRSTHIQMNKDLLALTAKKGIAVPAAITPIQKMEIDRLHKKSGWDYDIEYTELMKSKHKNAIDAYERMAEKTEDADIKEFAYNCIVEIKSHMPLIESCMNTIVAKREALTIKSDHGPLQ